MKIFLRNAFVLLLVLIQITSCAGRDPLLGNWEEPASGVTLELGKGGELTMGLKGVSFTMTYELQEPDIMIFKAGTEGALPDQKMTYRVEEDKLILTVDGVDTIFYRTK